MYNFNQENFYMVHRVEFKDFLALWVHKLAEVNEIKTTKLCLGEKLENV